MVMKTPVDALRSWFEQSESRLRQHGIEVMPRFPDQFDNVQDKAGFDFKSPSWLANFTVWWAVAAAKRPNPFWTDHTVLSVISDKIVLATEGPKSSLDEVLAQLSAITSEMISGRYDHLHADN
jgi:hypothetical protein